MTHDYPRLMFVVLVVLVAIATLLWGKNGLLGSLAAVGTLFLAGLALGIGEGGA